MWWFYLCYSTTHLPEILVDKASMLTLTVPEMTVLVGGIRVDSPNAGGIQQRRRYKQTWGIEQLLLY